MEEWNTTLARVSTPFIAKAVSAVGHGAVQVGPVHVAAMRRLCVRGTRVARVDVKPAVARGGGAGGRGDAPVAQLDGSRDGRCSGPDGEEGRDGTWEMHSVAACGTN